MDLVQAAQLIYTNVEEEQSPRKRRGYQTLFYTKSWLSDAEVLEIESRLFYVPKERRPNKHVFFSTETGKQCVARIVPLQDADQFGRTGRYFAHVLAFTPEAFSLIENNPFVVFRNSSFLTSVEESLMAGDFSSGDIASVVLAPEAITHTSSLIATLDRTQLQTLLILASQAERLRSERQALGFIGDPDSIFDLLENLFDLIPKSLRPLCSFDTLFVEGRLNRVPCWAVGLPSEQSRQPNILPIDLNTGSFLRDVRYEPQGIYGRWIMEALQSATHPIPPPVPAQIWRTHLCSDLARTKDSAFDLAEWFEGRHIYGSSADKVDAVLYAVFLTLGAKELEKRTLDRLKCDVGAALSERIAPYALEWVKRQGIAAIPALESGLPSELVLEWLTEALETTSIAPSIAESSQIDALLSLRDNPRLRLVHLRWAKRWEDLALELAQRNDAEFEAFARWALGTLPLSVQWGTSCGELGVMFGPQFIWKERDARDCRDLISALIGASVDLLDRAGASRRRSRMAVFGRASREAGHAVEAQIAPDLERWFCLLKTLKERTESTLS